MDRSEKPEHFQKPNKYHHKTRKKFTCLSLNTEKPDKNNCVGKAETKPEITKETSSLKRYQDDSDYNLQKRIKLFEQKPARDVNEVNVNVSGVEPLQDTFDNLDLTTFIQTLEKKTEPKQNCDKTEEFDAFKMYLKRAGNEEINRKLFKSESSTSSDSHFSFTQILENSQVVKDINAAFSLNKDTQKILETIPNDPTKTKISKNSTINGVDLFNNEELSTQYRKQVDNLFEQLEHTICVMGTEDQAAENNITQGLFNTSSIDNSLLNAVGIDASFGDAIKNILLDNAAKTPVRQKDKQIATNILPTKRKAVFRSLGPFYGLPLKVKQLIQQYKGIKELYDWQDECLKLPAIESKKNLIYALPTSGGKTLVAEILIFREIMCCNRNVLFILPFVAIVQEKVWALSSFAVALDFLVEEYASSKGTYPPRKRRRKRSVYIATIEKAHGLINSLIETGRLDEIGLVVVDELHLIGEQGRGPHIEALLTKLIYLKADVQIIGMSATIGNLEDICTFLKADVYTKNFRPVELTEYIQCANDIAKINWKAADEDDLFVESKTQKFQYTKALLQLDPDMLGGLVMEVVPSGSCLIFCASKKNCENVAILLCKIFKPELKECNKTERDYLKYALKTETGELCKVLGVSIPFGIAYHHSGLTSEERRLIEDGFRNGVLNVICCTSTLAAGVNLPAQRVILRSPYIGRDFINLSRYKQMVGRAGRAGLGEAGDSILITTPQDLPKVRNLIMSPMNQALSGMHLSEGIGLRHLLLSCISLGVANTRTDLQAVASSSLLAVQNKKLEVNVKKTVDAVISNLFKLGALEDCSSKENQMLAQNPDVSVRMETSVLPTQNVEETDTVKKKKRVVIKNNTKLVVSTLGRAAVKGGLELSKARTLYADLYDAQKSLVLLDCLHLLYLVTPYSTSEQVKPNMQIYFDLFSRLGPNEIQTAKTIGLSESVAVKMLTGQAIKNIPERILNRFYVTLMLYDLWSEMSVLQVAEKYQIDRGIVQNLMTNSATFASNVVSFCEQLEEFWAFVHLLKGISQRLSHCCVRELLPLMELPAVKQSRAKQLFNAGYKNLQSIAKANADDLVESIEFMSRSVANQLIAASKMLLLEKVENLREEAEDVLDGINIPQNFMNSVKQN